MYNQHSKNESLANFIIYINSLKIITLRTWGPFFWQTKTFVYYVLLLKNPKIHGRTPSLGHDFGHPAPYLWSHKLPSKSLAYPHEIIHPQRTWQSITSLIQTSNLLQKTYAFLSYSDHSERLLCLGNNLILYNVNWAFLQAFNKHHCQSCKEFANIGINMVTWALVSVLELLHYKQEHKKAREISNEIKHSTLDWLLMTIAPNI